MSEEKEVKYILDTLKKSRNLIYSNCSYLELDYKEQQKLNDYINGLKKEIEELKKPKYIMNFETGSVTKIDNDFISKDKIRDIIKEIGTYTFDSEEEIKKFDYCIYILKELLEEN